MEEYRLTIGHDPLPASAPLVGPPAASEQQIDNHLRLLADGDVSGAEDHFLGVFSTGLWWDLDPSPQGASDLYATQYDYANPWWDVYTLSAEWRSRRVLDHVRIGRQGSEHGLPITFDGASVGFSGLGRRLTLFGFGGQTVHFFASEPGFLEDWVASFGVVVRPHPALALEADSRWVQEMVPTREGERSEVTNHSYGLKASGRSRDLAARVTVRGLDERLSHLGGLVLLEFPALDLGVDGRLDAQLVTLGEIVESENPYYSLLGPSLPHLRYRLESWKELDLAEETTWSLHLGWRGRQVLNGREQAFNRSSGAVYFQTDVEGLGHPALYAGGTAEWNYVPDSLGREGLLAVGGRAGYQGDPVQTELGTYYQRYKIHYYQRASELENARTVYGMITYQAAQWLELRARYEFEILDRYLQSFFLSLRQDF